MTVIKKGIQLVPVKSSNIARLGWHDGTLHVEFSGGGLFSYAGVSSAMYNELLLAKSIGAHFAQHIRPKFKGVKV